MPSPYRGLGQDKHARVLQIITDIKVLSDKPSQLKDGTPAGR